MTSNDGQIPAALAVGRVLLGVASLGAPHALARAFGARSTPESLYLTRVYGIRALAMGFGYLTAGAGERARWLWLGLLIDLSDTAAGLGHLRRRDVPLRAAWPLVALTGTYAAAEALRLSRR
ncbi:hypothetical protein AB0H71_06215 [Nocardia sp. NPDC050697]|uniref:hypothetical protein n=1 Tax=Nocardia sp. NPDC050697 TaxID=3155158 RepID=UPI0033EE0454